MSIAYSPKSEVLEDVIRSSVAHLLLDRNNVKDLITVILERLPDLPPIQIPPDINLPDINLPGINLTEINLPDVNLTDINLPNINLTDINLPDLENLNTTVIFEILKSLIRVQAYNYSIDLRSIYAYEETTRKVIAAVEFDDNLHGL